MARSSIVPSPLNSDILLRRFSRQCGGHYYTYLSLGFGKNYGKDDSLDGAGSAQSQSGSDGRNPTPRRFGRNGTGPEGLRRTRPDADRTDPGLGVSFIAARNTPFQGLVADGAKLAMYDLLRAGYRTCAFIHDESLLQLPDDPTNWTTEPQRIVDIICRTMARVCGTVPIAAEYARMRRWYKGAKPVHDPARGALRCWEPKPSEPQPAAPLPEHSPKSAAIETAIENVPNGVNRL